MTLDWPSFLYSSGGGAWHRWDPFHPDSVEKTDFALASKCLVKAAHPRASYREDDGSRRDQRVAARHFSEPLRHPLGVWAESQPLGSDSHED